MEKVKFKIFGVLKIKEILKNQKIKENGKIKSLKRKNLQQ